MAQSWPPRWALGFSAEPVDAQVADLWRQLRALPETEHANPTHSTGSPRYEALMTQLTARVTLLRAREVLKDEPPP